ncbi:MAG TPA: acyl-CoA dehydrogenase family protein [Solirubrobacterales bacterium]|jgi:hypothetical protein
MDFSLSDEQQLIRETAREFADREIAPGARDRDREERFDLDLVHRIGAMGYIGATVSEDLGGAGLDYLSYGLILEELGRVDSSARTVVSVGTSLTTAPIARWGSAEQLALLPRLCRGEGLACFGLTEPDTGSDAGALRTKAVADGDGWRISGQKMWISLASHAEQALIFARTGEDPGHRGVTCFLVPTDREGFSTQRIHGKHGLRASDVSEVFLDEVEVGPEHVLGEVGRGFRVAMSALESGRFSVAAGCVGICQAALEQALSYAAERQQFGRSIASFQLVQKMLTEISVQVDAARALLWRAADAKDRGLESVRETSTAKLYASEAAVRCAGLSLQIHGGAGYVDDHPIERHLRDARVTTLYEGTSQVQEMIIGRALTGIDALAAG